MLGMTMTVRGARRSENTRRYIGASAPCSSANARSSSAEPGRGPNAEVGMAWLAVTSAIVMIPLRRAIEAIEMNALVGPPGQSGNGAACVVEHRTRARPQCCAQKCHNASDDRVSPRPPRVFADCLAARDVVLV